MNTELIDVEELLLAVLAADDGRRRAALHVLRGEAETAARGDDADSPVLMRMGEAARYLGLSRTTVWRLVREGRLNKIEMRRGSLA